MRSGVVVLSILKCSMGFFSSVFFDFRFFDSPYVRADSGSSIFKNKSGAILPFVLISFLAPLALVHAHENNDPVFDQYSISASARGEVTNDLLTAQLVVEHEDRDSAALANRVNADMAWALEQVHQHPAVKAKSGTYNTWPQYERNRSKVIGWRSRQVLKIESDDFDAARKAIKVLQERLQMNGIHRNYAAEGVASASVVNEPAIAAGSSEVMVLINGRIQLQ